MIDKVLTLFLGSKHDRDVKKIQPVIDQINGHAETIAALSDYELRGKTDEFKASLKAGKTLDDILPEAFAVVRETANRRMGHWQIFGNQLPEDFTNVKETAIRQQQQGFDPDISSLSASFREEYENTVKRLRKGENPHTIYLSGNFYNELRSWRPDDLIFQHRPFDVQLMGAVVLHRGIIAECKTGEGKTLMAVHAVYLNALSGNSVHIVTPNDYLAARDAVWMSPIYVFLGLKVGALQNEIEDPQRQEIYRGDIIYGTNSEFGFDYLRDNMKTNPDYLVQRDHAFAIVDEVDSILIDEARTPLIISGPSEESVDKYYKINKIIPRLVEDGKDDEGKYIDVRFREDEKFHRPTEIFKKNEDGEYIFDEEVRYFRETDGNIVANKYGDLIERDGKYIQDTTQRFIKSKKKGHVGEIIPITMGDYQIDEKSKNAHLTERGVRKVEHLLNIDNLFSPKNQEIVHHVSQALKAHKMFKKDIDYVVKDGKVLIVDEFTGRIKHGSRFSDGLHQALEAKESVTIERENQTLGSITIQNYFRMYKKLSGMTGTADTEAAEFKKIYKLDVIVIPTHLPIARIDYPDRIYRTKNEKLNAIVQEVKQVHENQQPILIGTSSIESSEELAKRLKKEGVPHNVLNAKFHEQEAEIIANAGQLGAVTIATNMAGRGTDIKVGPDALKRGGLYILGTARNESRRIDNQLRGRSGRQGNIGCSRFFLSLEDDLMRIFGSDRLSKIMLRLGMEEGQEIEHPMVSNAIASAQKKVEGHNFDIRKHLLDYDEVMNKQREYIYNERNTFLKGTNEEVNTTIDSFIPDVAHNAIVDYIPATGTGQEIPFADIEANIQAEFGIPFTFSDNVKNAYDPESMDAEVEKAIRDKLEEKLSRYPTDVVADLERYLVIQTIDDKWKAHLLEMDHLREGISFHYLAEKNPLTEYKFKGFEAFEQMVQQAKHEIMTILMRVEVEENTRLFDELDNGFVLSGQEVHDDFDSFSIPGREQNQGRIPGGAQIESDHGGETQTAVASKKISRNAPCPCGSGKKYKHCHGR